MATYQSDEQIRYGQAQNADERYHQNYAGGWADAQSRQGQLGREGVDYAANDATSAGAAQQRMALGQAARGGMAAGMGGGRGGSALARRAGMAQGAGLANEGVAQSSLLRAQEMQRAQKTYDASLNQQVQGHLGYTGLTQGLEQAQADQAQRDWLEKKREKERMYDQVSAAYGAVAGTIGSAAGGGAGMSDERNKVPVAQREAERGREQRATEAQANQATQAADAEQKRGSELLDAQRAYRDSQQRRRDRLDSLDKNDPATVWTAAAEGTAAIGDRIGEGLKEQQLARATPEQAAQVKAADGVKGAGAGGMGGGKSSGRDYAGDLRAANDRTAQLGPEEHRSMSTESPSIERYLSSKPAMGGEGSALLERTRSRMGNRDNMLEPRGETAGKYGVVDAPGQGLGIRVGSDEDAITVVPEGNNESAQAKMEKSYGPGSMSPGTAKPMPLTDYSLSGKGGPAQSRVSYGPGHQEPTGYDWGREYPQESGSVYMYPAGDIGLSDERRKTTARGELAQVDREAAQSMRELEPYHWRYKRDVQQRLGLSPREHVSPSAQDIERTPMGRNVVHDTADGKVVDTTGATLQGFTMMSSLQRQIDQLRADKQGGRRV